MEIVQALQAFWSVINDMGAQIMLPIVLFLIGLWFRMKPGDALKSGLYVGIGFIGVNQIISLMNTAIQPAIDYYQTIGTGFTYVDLPWAAVGAASWNASYAAIAVFVALLLNVLLVRVKVVKVLNVDIWNYIHMLFPAAVLYAFFGSWILSFLYVIALSVWVCLCAQWTSKKWGEQYGLWGTTCTTLSFVGWDYWFYSALNAIIDRIPGLNKVNVDAKTLNAKLGVLSDPCFMGLIVGAFLAIITGQPITGVITMAVQLAAVLVLLPRMVNLFMEGLAGIQSAASEYMMSKLGEGAEVNIGMDVCLGLGDTCALTSTIIMIPISIGLAFVLGLNYFPVGLLTTICYLCVMPTMVSKGNVFRTVLMMTIFFVGLLWLMNWSAPYCTQALVNLGLEAEAGTTYVTFFGGYPYTLIAILLGLLFGKGL